MWKGRTSSRSHLKHKHALVPDVVFDRLRVLPSRKHSREDTEGSEEALLPFGRQEAKQVSEKERRDDKEQRGRLELAVAEPLLETMSRKRQHHSAVSGH